MGERVVLKIKFADFGKRSAENSPSGGMAVPQFNSGHNA